MLLWTKLHIESLYCLKTAPLLLLGSVNGGKSGGNRLILVCRIHINTCNFVNYVMKITYYVLEDVGVILAGA